MSAVAIVGMMRSGTSITASLLNICGLELGAVNTSSILNVKGSFENPDFVSINQDLLAMNRGSFNRPPFITNDWLVRAESAGVTDRAKALAESFSSHAHWGWKQGATSIVMPFWDSIVPNLSYVVCFRNPLEVADSLTGKMGLSKAHGLLLWHFYMEMCMLQCKHDRSILVNNSDWYSNTLGTVTRVCEFLSISLPSDITALNSRFNDFFSHSEHHHSYTLEQLRTDPDVPQKTVQLYESLLNNENPINGLYFEDTYLTSAYFYKQCMELIIKEHNNG